MAVSVAITDTPVVTETLTAGSGSGFLTGDNSVTHQMGYSATLNSSSTPDATKAATWTVTMSGGAATIDMTSIPGVEGTFSASGLKPRLIKYRPKSDNANAITIGTGASNGYTGLGANFEVTLNAPSGSVVPWTTHYLGSGATAVSGSVKTLDVSGTGTQALEVMMIFGT